MISTLSKYLTSTYSKMSTLISRTSSTCDHGFTPVMTRDHRYLYSTIPTISAAHHVMGGNMGLWQKALPTLGPAHTGHSKTTITYT